jgi:hypothetical protein
LLCALDEVSSVDESTWSSHKAVRRCDIINMNIKQLRIVFQLADDNKPVLDFYRSLALKHFCYALSFYFHQLPIHLWAPSKQKALVMTWPLLTDCLRLWEPPVGDGYLAHFLVMLMVPVVVGPRQHDVQCYQKS